MHTRFPIHAVQALQCSYLDCWQLKSPIFALDRRGNPAWIRQTWSEHGPQICAAALGSSGIGGGGWTIWLPWREIKCKMEVMKGCRSYSKSTLRPHDRGWKEGAGTSGSVMRHLRNNSCLKNNTCDCRRERVCEREECCHPFHPCVVAL